MRLSEIQSYEYKEVNHVDLDILKEQIEEDCASWLSATNNGKEIAYRGVRASDAPAFRKHIRTNRQPSGFSDHEIVNYFIGRCKKKANRTNSISVTGSYTDANEFGESWGGATYIAIPAGKFHYSWHLQISDWGSYQTEDFLKLFGIDYNDELEQELLSGQSNELNWRIQNSFCSDMLGDDGSLIDAIQSGNEIMIHAKEYYGVLPDLYKQMFGG